MIEAFCETKRPIAALLALSLVVALIYAAIQFDAGFVAGTSAFWGNPRGVIAHSWGDMSTSLSGMLFFEQDRWRLPLFFVPKLGAPAGASMIVTDSLPLLALPARLLFRVTGHLINPFGAWTLACFIGSALSMTWLVALLGGRSFAAAVASALLGLCMPVLLYRWGHLALLGQFEVVLALSLYLRLRRGVSTRLAAAALLLCAAALWTHVYLLLMVGGILVAGTGQAAWDNRTERLRAGGLIASMAALVLALGKLSGHFDLPGPASADGFGLFSTNLLSPLVPQRSGLVPAMSTLVVDGTGGQYEGFAYLGGGVLVLLAFTGRGLAARVAAARRAHWQLLALMIAFVAIALSNNVYLGPWRVLHLQLPQAAAALTGIVRSSGRFCWPAIYLLTALAIAQAMRIGPRRGAALLAVAVVLQWIDTAPLRAAIRASQAQPAPYAIDPALLDRAMLGKQEIDVLPSYACQAAIDGRNKEIAVQVQLQAAWRNLATNTLYAGRSAADCEREHSRVTLPPGPGVAVVDLPSAVGFAGMVQASRTWPGCEPGDGYLLCGVDVQQKGYK